MKSLKSVIKECFENMYIVAKADMRVHFKGDKKQGKQWDMARALVFLHDVAKNPDLYFAPEYTNAAWDKRVDDYIKKSSLSQQNIQEHGVDYVRGVTKGSFVGGPGEIVYEKLKLCFQDRVLWNFCDEVQNFYYKNFLENVYVNEDYIARYAKKIANWAKVAQAKNCVERGFRKQVYGSYER